VCQPGRNANTVNPSWQKTVGYSLKGDQWADLKGQIVSCDSSGAKYVLGQAVYAGTDITSVNTGLQQNSGQWVVNLSLNAGGRLEVRDAHHQPVQLVLRRLPERQPR
jgi:preprotein translocase subunit SecD